MEDEEQPTPLPNDKVDLKNQKPIVLLAITILEEARGESHEGKIAVGHVVLNRMRDPRWPDTVTDVVLQPHQFTGVWAQREKVRLLFPVVVHGPDVWLDCMQAACDVMVTRLPDPTDGATHYHAASISPWWSRSAKMHLKCRIGNHVFYWEEP